MMKKIPTPPLSRNTMMKKIPTPPLSRNTIVKPRSFEKFTVREL